MTLKNRASENGEEIITMPDMVYITNGWMGSSERLTHSRAAPTIDMVRFDVVANAVATTTTDVAAAAAPVVIIIITQSYCESISISCNG